MIDLIIRDRLSTRTMDMTSAQPAISPPSGDPSSAAPAIYVSKFHISAVGDTLLVNLFGLGRASLDGSVRFPLAFAGVLPAALADELAAALNQVAMARQTLAADPAHPQ